MAAKTFQCVICQAEVSKPQSYAYKDGRACRYHPEVQEAHSSSEQAKKAELEQSKYRAKNPRHTWGETPTYENPNALTDAMAAMGIKDPNKHCWCCHKDGVYEHLIYERFLINFSKAELKSDDVVPFLQVEEGKLQINDVVRQATIKEFGENKVPLRRIEVSNNYPDWKLNQVLTQKRRDDKKQIVRMTGLIVLCRECATKYEFPWLYASEQVKTKEQIEHMMLIAGLIKPTLQSIAASEITRDELSDIMNKGK